MLPKTTQLLGFWLLVNIPSSFLLKCPENVRSQLSKSGPDSSYLLDAFELLASNQFVSTDKRFQLSFCEKISTASGDKAGLIDYSDKERPTVIGLFDNVVAQVIDSTPSHAVHMFHFRYGGGTPYNGTCNNSSRQANVLVICDTGVSKEGQLVSLDNASACTNSFVLSTKLICNLTSIGGTGTATATTTTTTTTTTVASRIVVDHSLSKVSPLGGFFIVLFVCIFCYFFLGILYKRQVLGARGAQQLPNYLFWLRVSRNIQDCFSSNRASSRYSTAATRVSDDEHLSDRHLMSDDDFKYDHPPLNIGAHAGGHSQQPLNAGSSPRPVQSQRPQLLTTVDDNDERLLQV